MVGGGIGGGGIGGFGAAKAVVAARRSPAARCRNAMGKGMSYSSNYGTSEKALRKTAARPGPAPPAAIGAAGVLRHLEPRIVEREEGFEVRLPRDLTRSEVDLVEPGFSYLLRRGKTAPNVPPERIVQLPAEARGAESPAAPGAAANDRMYVILSRMKAYAGPNKVVSQFATLPRDVWTKRVWQSLHGEPNFTRPPSRFRGIVPDRPPWHEPSSPAWNMKGAHSLHLTNRLGTFNSTRHRHRNIHEYQSKD